MDTTSGAWALIEQLGQMLEAFLLPWMARFVADGSHFAAGLALMLIGFSILIGVVVSCRFIPTWISLRRRIKLLKRLFKPASSDEDRRLWFAEQYADQIDPLMANGYRTTAGRWFCRLLTLFGDEVSLQLAWSEIKETIIDEDSKHAISNTVRPHGYLMRVVPKPQRIANIAALFVSIGLFLTFLGIISVLLKASCDIRRSNETVQYGICPNYLTTVSQIEMQLGSQPDELTLPASATPSELANTENIVISIVGGAASKFYASIGGLAASIILKVLLEFYSFFLRRSVEELADLIERGLAFRPEQQLAVEQLRESREHTQQLKTFNTDFAITVGERLNAAIQPMTEQLSNIQGTLTQQATDTANALKQGAANAINDMASGEIELLGQVLGDLREELAGLRGKLSESGDVAAGKMAEAANNLEIIAGRIGKQLQSSATNFSDSGNQLGEHLVATTTKMETAIGQMLAGMEAAQQANAEAAVKSGKDLENTIGRLTSLIDETAVERISAQIDASIGAAVTEASAQTSQAAREAGMQIRQAFEDASAQWITAVDGATTRIEALAGSMERNVQAVGRHAEAVDSAANSATEAGAAIGQSAANLKSATDPIRLAADNIRIGTETIATTVSSVGEVTASSLSKIEELIQQMNSTANSAEQAWADYQTRFGEVDEHLEQAVRALAEALSGNTTRMQQYVSEIDSELAKAVSQLANAVHPLTEFADEIETLLQKAASRDQA